MNTHFKKIFKQGSTTYHTSSLFFPKKEREAVFTLYAFVRTVDDFVDMVPQDRQGFYDFKNAYTQSLAGKASDNEVIEAFIQLQRKYGFEQSWIDAFFASMEADITTPEYKTLNDTLSYIYGSAEVIGLMMARILNLPLESYPFAQMLGRAMQYINFLRDIKEDLELGRTYFPQEDFAQYSLPDLTQTTTQQHSSAFSAFMKKQSARYKEWQQEAEKGFDYIPQRFRIPIATASRMYLWTAQEIEKNPYRVYTEKIKPSRLRIITTLLTSLI